MPKIEGYYHGEYKSSRKESFENIDKCKQLDKMNRNLKNDINKLKEELFKKDEYPKREFKIEIKANQVYYTLLILIIFLIVFYIFY